LLGQRGNFGCCSNDLEGDLHRSGPGTRNVLTRSDRRDKRQVCRGVLFDELLGAHAQALGASVHLSRIRPVLARKLRHLLHQGRRRRSDRCRS
jgi:hypothetical protein